MDKSGKCSSGKCAVPNSDKCSAPGNDKCSLPSSNGKCTTKPKPDDKKKGKK